VTSPTPVLHVLAGPNGAGKTTFYERVLAPATSMDFVNADRIADNLWAADAMTHAREASVQAAAVRERLMASRTSFITETVFSHHSKVDLVRQATSTGYLVYLHVLIVPLELAVLRVAQRVDEDGGHNVPEEKIRARYARLWGHVAEAIADTCEARVYDSSGGRFVPVARFRSGSVTDGPRWPAWTPPELRAVAE
jgi:predicted ABC-type ATPase